MPKPRPNRPANPHLNPNLLIYLNIVLTKTRTCRRRIPVDNFATRTFCDIYVNLLPSPNLSARMYFSILLIMRDYDGKQPAIEPERPAPGWDGDPSPAVRSEPPDLTDRMSPTPGSRRTHMNNAQFKLVTITSSLPSMSARRGSKPMRRTLTTNGYGPLSQFCNSPVTARFPLCGIREWGDNAGRRNAAIRHAVAPTIFILMILI